MGTKKHSKTQQNIQYYIRQKYGQAFDPLPELTTRLRKRSFMSLMSLSKIGRTTSMSAFTVALDLRANYAHIITTSSQNPLAIHPPLSYLGLESTPQ
jgi:hypothetical protein